jgi:hypothetical protein
MKILAKDGPVAVSGRITALERHHSGARKDSHRHADFLVDTHLSSSRFLTNSTRHSVTSRIAVNSRALCYLIFSTRHLNATLVKRNFVEKFNTPVRFFAASVSNARALRRIGETDADARLIARRITGRGFLRRGVLSWYRHCPRQQPGTIPNPVASGSWM